MKSTLGVKVGDRIVKVLSCAGLETATLPTVTEIKGKRVWVSEDERAYLLSSGQLEEPSSFGSVRLIPIEK